MGIQLEAEHSRARGTVGLGSEKVSGRNGWAGIRMWKPPNVRQCPRWRTSSQTPRERTNHPKCCLKVCEARLKIVAEHRALWSRGRRDGNNSSGRLVCQLCADQSTGIQPSVGALGASQRQRLGTPERKLALGGSCHLSPS